MGIRADAPHKIWHMDITEFKTMDNGRAYIHILIDNFSRFILGFRVSLHKKAQNTLDVLRDAYKSFIVPMIKDNPDLLLLSDSGSENKAKIVQDFIKQESNYLTHLKTIVDIEYSNNMIEAYNKTLKYRFLYTRNLPDFNALEKHLPQAIQEYNEVRPHYAHKYLTPQEVLNGERVIPGKFNDSFKQARMKRNRVHANPDCLVCSTDKE